MGVSLPGMYGVYRGSEGGGGDITSDLRPDVAGPHVEEDGQHPTDSDEVEEPNRCRQPTSTKRKKSGKRKK